MKGGVWDFGLSGLRFLVLAGTESLGGVGRLMRGWRDGRRYIELYLSERAGVSSILRDIFQHRMAT
jgi:hypothetical protein